MTNAWLNENVKVCARCGHIYFQGDTTTCPRPGCAFPAYYGYDTIFYSRWNFIKTFLRQLVCGV